MPRLTASQLISNEFYDLMEMKLMGTPFFGLKILRSPLREQAEKHPSSTDPGAHGSCVAT